MVIPRLRSPIVLIHGLFGFGRLQVGGLVLADYFPGIATAMREAGNQVLQARLTPTAGIAERAQELKTQIEKEYASEPVHLIGHSMGGLDARYLISRLNMADQVLSLTTIGTPHRGSSFADWSVHRFGSFLQPVLDLLSVPYQAFFDLTTQSCQKFNEEVPDRPGVRYFSVAGRFECNWSALEWSLSASILRRKEGDNDGVVSVTSATYGESCEVWDADHFSLVNWYHPIRPPKNRIPDYGRLVARLADQGF